MSESLMSRNGGQNGAGIRLASLLLEKIGARMFGTPRVGAVTVTLPDGRSRRLGDPHTGVHAHLIVNDLKVLRETMTRGTLGFAAAYISGDIEIPDLTAMFRFFLQNKDVFDRANPGLFRRAARDLAYHVARANTREGAQRNIAAHYDLGNDFYAEWLDETMTYSAGYFDDPDQPLEAAQRKKYHLIAEMLGLEGGDDILEIGCGWGGFAEIAAGAYGANVSGITLSSAQLEYGQKRIARAGLTNSAQLEYRDYRDVEGTYDHVASIEMIEAVGEEHWPVYFGTVHDRLKPGGTAAVQAITIHEDKFERYRAAPDFIQRYIFPGGMLLTKPAMRTCAEEAGLVFEREEAFGMSYATTLRLWRQRFLERWPRIAKLGYSTEFKRKWLYYLSYCEAGFLEGAIDVGIYTYRRPT